MKRKKKLWGNTLSSNRRKSFLNQRHTGTQAAASIVLVLLEMKNAGRESGWNQFLRQSKNNLPEARHSLLHEDSKGRLQFTRRIV